MLQGSCFVIFIIVKCDDKIKCNFIVADFQIGHRPRSPRQNIVGGAPPGPSSMSSPQAGIVPHDSVATPNSAASPMSASSAPSMAAIPVTEGLDLFKAYRCFLFQ